MGVHVHQTGQPEFLPERCDRSCLRDHAGLARRRPLVRLRFPAAQSNIGRKQAEPGPDGTADQAGTAGIERTRHRESVPPLYFARR